MVLSVYNKISMTRAKEMEQLFSKISQEETKDTLES